MKRFYTDATVGRSDAGYAVLLDGKPLLTPKRAALALPTKALAEAIAGEWRSQAEEFDPAAMYLTKYANSAIDLTAGHEEAVIDGILAYANDLLCYRAEGPADLVARQAAAWDPLLSWAAERFGVRLRVVTGITPVRQEEASLAAFRASLAGKDAFALTALHGAVPLCGSLVLGLALLEGRLAAEEAFAASQVDEAFQAEKWGRDALAEARAKALLAELMAATRAMRLAQARDVT